MTKLNRSIMWALTIMAGFAGGMTSNVLFTTQQLHAQGANPRPTVEPLRACTQTNKAHISSYATTKAWLS